MEKYGNHSNKVENTMGRSNQNFNIMLRKIHFAVQSRVHSQTVSKWIIRTDGKNLLRKFVRFGKTRKIFEIANWNSIIQQSY